MVSYPVTLYYLLRSYTIVYTIYDRDHLRLGEVSLVMLSRIRKRAYELFLIGCLFGIGILYYYAIVITAIPHRPLSVTLRNVSRRELYHTRYHRPSILLASTEWHSEKEDHLEGYKTKWNSKDQQIRLLKTEIKSNHKFQKLSHFNKLIPAESIPNDITESKKLKVKLDRYSIVPVPSSSVFEIVRGGEFLDKRVLEVSLGCKAIIYRDKINAYGKCKNFTRMRFINGSRTVAMASFPGSGSTWVRSVLEQASGIYTGSIYCDNELKSKGFVGEKVSSSNVLFVKTHYASKDLFIPLSEYYDPKKFKDITAAILLIRNPLDSIISSWNWVHSGHTATVPASSFGM